MNSTKKEDEHRNVVDGSEEQDIRMPTTMPLITIELIRSLVATSCPSTTLRSVGIPATLTSEKMTIRRR